MFDKFLKKHGYTMILIIIICVAFMAGVMCGLLIGLKQVESAEQAIVNNSVAEVEETHENAQKTHENAQKTHENAVVEVSTPDEVSTPVNMGEFRLTAYCPCNSCSGGYGRQTSTGATAKEGRTVAVDPSVIPYGSVVIINGVEYVAEDCGGLIKGKKIDIYFESHEKAERFGVQAASVYLKG